MVKRETWCVLVLVGLLSGCFKVTTVNISQKTSLEHQLMGELEPLSEEELLASSVRGGGGVASGSMGELQALAVAARRRQLFNRDDIDELKRAGCLGEARMAELVARACEAVADGQVAATRERVLTQERVDRQRIIDWALATDPVLTPADRSQVVGIYAQLLREQAEAGTWIQDPDGTWQRR